MKVYGSDIDSRDAWDQMAKTYADRLANEYHRHRLSVINSLIPEDLYVEGKRVLDFGCGDAVLFEQFLSKGCNITGMDVSAEMVALAARRLSRATGGGPDLVALGGAADLARLQSGSLDAILSFNVLAYLTGHEVDLFYTEAYRLLRPGGYLIVTHSNELFDLYSLNNYTVAFFQRHFLSDSGLREAMHTLVAKGSQIEGATTYNVRENPLAYQYKLRGYGFVERRQEFINLHEAPPPLLSTGKSYPDTLSWKEEEKWKLMFVCSTFGSLSVREG